MLRRTRGLINFFQVTVPQGTKTQEWFGRFACFDPMNGVLGPLMQLTSAGDQFFGDASKVELLSGGQRTGLIVEIHYAMALG